MHTSAAAAEAATATSLTQITRLLSLLLLSTLSVKSFLTRWHTIRTKLSNLHNSLTSIASSPHFSQNELLISLLPNLHSTLQRLTSLSQQCLDASSSFQRGKLLMQSDLDILSSSLSDLLHHLDLLIKSGTLHHSSALILSNPDANSDHNDVVFFVKDLFTRLQIGGTDIKVQSLHSLNQLLQANSKSAAIVAAEGDVAYLIHLLEFNNTAIRDLAALTILILAAAGGDARKTVFEEGGLGPLLRLIETGSMTQRERAAAAVEFITSDSENAWAVTAYGGVSILLNAAISGHLSLQISSIGAIRNISSIEDVRLALTEVSAIPILVNLISSGNQQIVSHAVHTVDILSSADGQLRDLVIREKCLNRLIQLVLDPSTTSTIEHALHALLSLSTSDPVSVSLASNSPFVLRLAELIKLGQTASIQYFAASLIGDLPISESVKRAIGSCTASLLKLMESVKPAGVQNSAAKALVSILTVRSNRRDLIGDEKSLTRLVRLLDPRNETVDKELPVMVVLTLVAGGGHGCRKKLVDAGLYKNLQCLAGMDVVGAKKAERKFAGAGSKLKSIFSLTWME